jgi:general secretion pathway protein K
MLPARTTVNINTAPADVIFALVPELQLADAKKVLTSREGKHFASLQDAASAVPALKDKLQDTQFSVATQYFEVSGRIRLEQTVVEEHSLVVRDASRNVKTLWRERAVVASAEKPAGN